MWGPNKILHDDKIERITAERRGAQPVEIKQAQAGIGRDRIHAGIIADLPPRPSSLRCIAEVAPRLCLAALVSQGGALDNAGLTR
jgi:hypothetical protein